jgi:hypothetical protein
MDEFTDEDIQIIPAKDLDYANPLLRQVEKKHLNINEILREFATIGRSLAQTYSESNQETGEGFVESLKIIENMLVTLRDVSPEQLTLKERDGLVDLLKYLKVKLKRRMRAVDGNSVNM